MLKKIFLCLCLLSLCLSLCACGGSSGVPSGFKEASALGDGFLLYVPEDYIVSRNIIPDGDKTTTLVRATVSISEKTNIAVVSVASTDTPEAYYAETFSEIPLAYKPIEKEKETVTFDGGTALRVIYEYAIDKEIFRVKQYFASRDDRMLTFTYTGTLAENAAGVESYLYHEKTIDTIFSHFKSASFEEPTTQGYPDENAPEGFVRASAEVAPYVLYVPKTWQVGLTSDSDYAKAISPDGGVLSVTSTLPTEMTPDDYLDGTHKTNLLHLFGDSLKNYDKSEEVKFGKDNIIPALRKDYSGILSGETYQITELHVIKSNVVYTLTYLYLGEDVDKERQTDLDIVLAAFYFD